MSRISKLLIDFVFQDVLVRDQRVAWVRVSAERSPEQASNQHQQNEEGRDSVLKKEISGHDHKLRLFLSQNFKLI